MKRPAHLTVRSRRLRTVATKPERILWNQLRAGRLGGFKFRRQHSMLGHILDFACVEARLAIELDGASHNASRIAADNRKDDVLRQHKWHVIRFSNKDVHDHLPQLVDHILRMCRKRVDEPEG